MKINRFKNVDDIKINFEKFPSESKILFVTGLSGSGKSWTAKELAESCGASIFQPEWLIHSKHVSQEFKPLLDEFLRANPEIVPYVENKWNDVKNEDEHELLQKYINMFLQSFLDSCDKSRTYIVEGLQIFTLIDFEVVKNLPIIVKGTSSFQSLRNRLKRDLPKHKNKTSYLFKVLKQSHLYQFKHRKKLNNFLKKLQKLEKTV